MRRAVDVDLPFLMADTDRHGKPRLYVRRYGRKIRMHETPGTPAFAKAYAEGVDKLAQRMPKDIRAAPVALRGTLGWLASLYFASQEFIGLDIRSQRIRRGVIEECLRETIRDGSPDVFRDCPLGFVTPAKIKRLRDLKADKPGAANNRRKYLSALFGWAIEDGKTNNNPVRDIRRIKYASDGFHTWTLDEVRQYRDRHAIGTKARLALELLLFVGVRRGDFVMLGRQHFRDGAIRFVASKTKRIRPEAMEIPLLPSLQAVIDATPTGDLAFFVTEYGKPFTAAGFGNWFRDRCVEAGVPGRAHGLRKAGATIAANEGATIHQLMAMYGWTTPSQAMIYTKRANQKKLAREGVTLLARGTEEERESVPPKVSASVPPK
jgi:integrase